MQTSSSADFRQRVEAKRYGFFTFPTLEVTIKYRKPDILKLALNNSLPTALADQIIKGYRANLEGTVKEALEEAKSTKIEADNKLLGELRDKGYVLLDQLCVSHRIMNVEQSDFDNDVISWNDVPEEDAIAFLLHLIQTAQSAQTVEGGEVSREDIDTFPDSKRKSKRATSR